MRRRTLTNKNLIYYTQKITSSTNWTVPSGCTSIEVYAIGGGGGSGVCGHAGGGGGGGGQIIHTTISVTPGSIIQVTIGQGGYNGRNNGSYNFSSGTNGEATTFGTVSAAGGYVGG